MKHRIIHQTLFAGMFISVTNMFFSCSENHLPNIEVDITNVILEGNDGLIKKTIQENSVILYIDTVKTDLKNMVVNYTVSEDAKWEYVKPNGSHVTTGDDIDPTHYDSVEGNVTDYSSPVYIKVTAARGTDPSTGKTWSKVWKISTLALVDNMPTSFSFDNWYTPAGCLYQMPYDELTEGASTKSLRLWDSTCGQLDPIWQYVYGSELNDATKAPYFYQHYGCQPTDDAVSGKALKLVTAGISWADATKPFVSGLLFMGELDGVNVDDQLKTRVGMPFNKVPESLDFSYKYLPENKPDGTADTGLIRVVLFKADNNVPYLTGYNILDNDNANVVAYAELRPGKQDTYKSENIPFTYTQEIPDEDIKNWKYSLAVYFASSLEGFSYNGGAGSTLYIDNFNIKCKQ